MRGFAFFALGAAAMAISLIAPARADEAAYIVSYIEVAPVAKDQAAALLRQISAASRKDDAAVRFEILQRIDRPHHFAVLEVWKDQKALAAHAAAAHTREFRNKLRAIHSAPYDERAHAGLAAVTPAAQTPQGAIYAVTHVDFIPPKKDEGIAALQELVPPSRKAEGNLRFDVLQQTNRPNHLTIVEAWKTQDALDAHATAAHLMQFRDRLLPMSGSLYDERLYRSLD